MKLKPVSTVYQVANQNSYFYKYLFFSYIFKMTEMEVVKQTSKQTNNNQMPY